MIKISSSKNKNLFSLNFHEKEIEMKFCELLFLRNKINAINIDTHFYSDSNFFGIEIISICSLKHVLIFETEDLLSIKYVLENIFSNQKHTVLL